MHCVTYKLELTRCTGTRGERGSVKAWQRGRVGIRDESNTDYVHIPAIQRRDLS